MQKNCVSRCGPSVSGVKNNCCYNTFCVSMLDPPPGPNSRVLGYLLARIRALFGPLVWKISFYISFSSPIRSALGSSGFPWDPLVVGKDPWGCLKDPNAPQGLQSMGRGNGFFDFSGYVESFRLPSKLPARRLRSSRGFRLWAGRPVSSRYHHNFPDFFP